MLMPFISQIAASTLCRSDGLAAFSYCHKMSDLPSPLKSPVAIACQPAGGAATMASEVGDKPFINQIAASPFCGSEAFEAFSYCHKISASPSALKSPVVTVCQPGGA